MTSWMTIETAPKDGSEVDLWIGGKRFVDCFWYPHFNAWAYKHGYPEQTCVMRDASPTHWMEKPSPPEGAF